MSQAMWVTPPTAAHVFGSVCRFERTDGAQLHVCDVHLRCGFSRTMAWDCSVQLEWATGLFMSKIMLVITVSCPTKCVTEINVKSACTAYCCLQSTCQWCQRTIVMLLQLGVQEMRAASHSTPTVNRKRADEIWSVWKMWDFMDELLHWVNIHRGSAMYE